MDYGLFVHLTGVAVGGTALEIDPGALGVVAIDTGTSMIDLDVDDAIIGALAADSAFQKLFGDASWFQSTGCTSVAMSAAELDATLPTLAFTFGSNPPVSVRAGATSSYLEAQPAAGGATTWCPAIFPTSGSSFSGTGSGGSGGPDDAGIPNLAGEIGVPFLRSSVVIFDRQNQRLGFAPHSCE
jgi:Xylanase inhibitor C-terminal